MRLDHLIATVPEIRATHARLLAMGFEEAWPVGPFWPAALTSGIALGGANLELVQPEAGVSEGRIDTLVLAPGSFEEARDALAPYAFSVKEKAEPDPVLLALRGFPAELTAKPQTICHNFYPEDTPYPFFLCVYAPFLKARLAPESFAEPQGPVVSLSLVVPDPEAVRHLFAGRLGPVGLDVDPGARPEVAEIRFADGTSLSAFDLQETRSV